MPTDTRILVPGESCERRAHLTRGAFLIDGCDYYRAFRQALRQATHSVVMLAWDLHSELRLERDEDEDDGYPSELGGFVHALLEEKQELQIHLLVWDYSMIYLAEREWTHFSKWLSKPHPRLHLALDDALPAGASHHQKVVVVDGVLAFAGGMDLSVWRWDTSEHRAEDPRRTDPKGKPYGPYHDVQMALTGPIAGVLQELCAQRWKRATGEVLTTPPKRAADAIWPDELSIDISEREIGLARTYAPFDPYPGVREIEDLHLRVIAAAQRYLYFENQYLSTRRLTEALIKRLREADGPEILIVLTQDTDGWIEEHTMGLLRNRLLERLHEADAHDRLRVVYPEVRGADGNAVAVYVHAKVLIADDRIVKIGSSNLSNRSMRVDSELDLTIAETEPFPAAARLLHRLLADHLGTTPDAIANKLEEQKSLRALLDAQPAAADHALVPIRYGCEGEMERQLADSQLLDPEEPIDPAYWIRQMVPDADRGRVLRRILVIAAIVAGGLGLVALLRWGWGQVIDKATAIAILEQIQQSPWSPVVLAGLFLIAGLVGLSLNLLLVAAAVVLSPWIALGAGLVGGQASAIIAFALGRRWGQPLLRRFGSKRMAHLSRRLANHGVLSVALVRLLPIAPFPVINLAAGSSHLPFGVFNLGTLVGMAPGMLAGVLLAERTVAAVRHPDATTLTTLGLVLVAVIGAVWFIRRSLRRRRASAN